MIEYDAAPSVGVDDLVTEFRRQNLDFLGHPIKKSADTYWWTSTMLRFYTRDQVRPYQVCAAVFSARAIRHLAECRLRQGRSGVSDGKQWPIGETFVGTELALADFRLRDLSSFGRMTRYDWWPPIHEAELPDCAGEVFVHPVLAGRRYVTSLFKSGILSGLIVTAKLIAAAAVRRTPRRKMTPSSTLVPASAPVSPAQAAVLSNFCGSGTTDALEAD